MSNKVIILISFYLFIYTDENKYSNGAVKQNMFTF